MVGLLIGSVGYAYSPGKIDEIYLHLTLFPKLRSKVKELPCKGRIIVIRHCAARKESMYAEMLHAVRFKHSEGFRHLLPRHSVFAVSGVIHDVI